jgi:hypothetical protein
MDDLPLPPQTANFNNATRIRRETAFIVYYFDISQEEMKHA